MQPAAESLAGKYEVSGKQCNTTGVAAACGFRHVWWKIDPISWGTLETGKRPMMMLMKLKF
jgi:hypothetical protein